MTFQTFYISVAVLLAALLCAAVAIWIIESKFNKKHPANQDAIDLEGNSVKVSGEKIYLAVENGAVSVIDELPTIEVEVGEPRVVEKIVEKIVRVPADGSEGEVTDDIPTEEAAVESEDNTNMVSFERSETAQKVTFADKLAALPKEDLERYHNLVNYILAKPNAKHVITNNMAIFKIHTSRMMVASVKRGIVTLQFTLGNSDLERFVRDEKARIKVPTVTIRLVDDASLENAKKTADITASHLETEREWHKEQKREQRREQRARAKELAAQAAAANATDGDDKK